MFFSLLIHFLSGLYVLLGVLDSNMSTQVLLFIQKKEIKLLLKLIPKKVFSQGYKNMMSLYTMRRVADLLLNLAEGEIKVTFRTSFVDQIS